MRSDREDAPVGRRVRSDSEGGGTPDGRAGSDSEGGTPVGRRVGSDGEGGTPVGRRVVLGVLALGGISLAFGRKLSDGEQAALAVVGPRDPTGLTQLIPAGAGFRFYSVTASIPRRRPADVRITVGGLVRRSRTWSMAELARLPQATLVRDFQCVTGWRVPGVTWSGVALPDLLAAAEPRPEATAVRFTSYDGAYSESLTLEQARRRDVLVATGLEGKPVSAAHGGPVRIAVLPMYGYKSLKWLDRIELTREVEPGFWEHRGYDVDGWVGRSNGRSDEPT